MIILLNAIVTLVLALTMREQYIPPFNVTAPQMEIREAVNSTFYAISTAQALPLNGKHYLTVNSLIMPSVKCGCPSALGLGMLQMAT